MIFQKISKNPKIQSEYERMIQDGTAPKLAEMFALRSPPRINTDATFLEGRWNQFADCPQQGDYYKSVAEEYGQDVKGKVYLSQLARFPGDPEAWVSGRGDVQRVCEERGWGCSGAVNVKAANLDEPPAEVAVAADIVDAKVDEILATVPDPQWVDRQDLRDQVAEKIKPHWAND